MHACGRAAILVGTCCLGLTISASAQTPAAMDSLRRSLTATSARLDSLEAGLCPGASITRFRRTGNAVTDSLAATLERLDRRLAALRASRCTGGAPAQTPDSSGDLAALRAAAAAAAGQAAPSDTTETSDTIPSAEAAPPQAAGPRGANLLNPEISATGDIRIVAAENVRGDNTIAREFEFAFQSALDPYSSTKIFLAASDEGVEIEEGYIYYTGLPGRLRLDFGKFRQQVGDLNRWHAHALPETEYPLVYQRFFGEEGLAGVGLSLYTSLPVSLAGGTHEAWLQGTTAESDPFLAGSRQLMLLGRVQNFWQLSRSTYAQIGFTGLGGNNHDADLRSRLIGADFRVTYRPPNAGTRRGITFRAEGYRFHANELGTTTNRYGTFLDLQARASRRWILGARYDYVEAPRGISDTEWRITPNVTWWQSEFVYLRLEGEHRNTELEGSRNMLSLQAVWAMGPHKHETY